MLILGGICSDLSVKQISVILEGLILRLQEFIQSCSAVAASCAWVCACMSAGALVIMVISSAYMRRWECGDICRSDSNMLNSSGLNIDPCGTSLFME